MKKSAFWEEIKSLASNFETQNSALIRSGVNPPCLWGSNINKTHYTQLDVRRVDGKRVKLDDALLDNTPVAYDKQDRPIYKLIYHDSKLSADAPWTDNQLSEIINIFKNDPSKQFIEFEARNSIEYFDKIVDSKILTGSKVRIYRNDVYKSIGNGDGGAIVKTIQIFK